MNAIHHRTGFAPDGQTSGWRDTQQEVADFISSPVAHGGMPVRRIDTHISHIFLAGDRAFKMKRAVKLDFLDYTSLTMRRQQCLNEVAANQAMAPDLYVGVVPVTRQPAGLAIDGGGEPVEWLVEMVRFDESTQLDRLAEAGHITQRMMRDLGDTVALAHCESPVRRDQGGRTQLAFFLDYVGKALADQDPEGGDGGPVARWRTLFSGELDRRAARLDARRRHGFVRHCHGDLHLANICVFNGRATPFDAIEFNDTIACCDVLYDLAFPLMDLVRFGKRDLANTLFNRYLANTRGYGDLALLPLFMSMRAAIRAMAAALGPDSDGKRETIDTHVGLALRLLTQPSNPRLIAIGGLSGTGKSTVAAALSTVVAEGAGAVVLRSDVIRKRLLGCLPEQELGHEAYDRKTDEAVFDLMLKDARRALRAGTTVIADATFLDPKLRSGVEAIGRACDVPFDGLWLEAAPDVLRDRLAHRGPDASDATAAVMELQARRETGTVDWHRVNTQGAVASTVARASCCLR